VQTSLLRSRISPFSPEELAELEADLKVAKPIQFRENIALVVKYYDRLAPMFFGDAR